MIDDILERCPPDGDPMLARRSPANRRLAHAGAAFHLARICEVFGDEQGARAQWLRFLREWRRAAE